MPIRVYNEDKETEVGEEEEVLYPRRSSSEELSGSFVQPSSGNGTEAPLVWNFFSLFSGLSEIYIAN